MKDKEMIEEMGKALLEYIKVYGKLHLTVDGIDNTARLFAKFGITKLPKDSVVLSREEIELLKNDLDKGNYGEFESGFSQGYKKGSKETAEKITNRLIEIFSTAMGVCSGCALQHDKNKNPTAREFQFGKYKGFEVAKNEVKELAKQFGVEIGGDK